jgi:hypothetical protein
MKHYGVWQPKAKYGAICKYIPIKLLIGSSKESTNIVDSFYFSKENPIMKIPVVTKRPFL